MQMRKEVKKERRRVRREWYGKNWKWIVSYVIPGLILAIVLYSISISFIVSKLQQNTFLHLKLCVGSSITKNMTELVVPSNRCNSWLIKTLDLSEFTHLKSIEIGDECFKYVNKVKVIGLNQLERVVIGRNSFTKKKDKDWPGYDPESHFSLKNCERLTVLKMGRYSFCDYSVCEIENVPSLKEIIMGELDNFSWNFHYASLELKSDSERMK